MAHRGRTVAISAAILTLTTAIGAGTNLLTPLVPVEWVGRYAVPLMIGVVLAIGAVVLLNQRSHGTGPSATFRAKRVASSSARDGVMDVFTVTATGGLVANRYQEPGHWSGWLDLRPNGQAVDVAAVATGVDRTEIFYVDVSGQIWWAERSAGERPHWGRVPGNPRIGRVIALAALSGWPGHREIYAVGDHGKVAHTWRWHDTAWHAWQPGDSPVPCRDVALSVPSADLLECFTVGMDGRIRHRWFHASEGRWTEWIGRAGEGLPNPVVAIDVLNGWPDHQEIFAVRTDGKISHRDHQRGHDWKPWRDRSAPVPFMDLAAGVTSEGHLELIAGDRDGSLWQRSYADGVWWSERWQRVPAASADIGAPA